jgi:predicted metal-dependent phosphoesterase TrpH
VSCDFHLHSDVSDGSLAPAAVVEAAAAEGVQALALTDHDDVSGVCEARVRGAELGVEVLSGVEISVCEDDGALQLHLLGFGIEIDDDSLLETLAGVRRARSRRAERICARLGEQGIDLDPAQLRGHDGAVGRMHIAQELVADGHCGDVDEAFARYLRRGRPAYEKSAGIPAQAAIDAIHAAGGIACLAHPPLSVGANQAGGLEQFVERLVRQGLDGVEVHHPGHKKTTIRRLRGLAKRYDLVATGGSDFHGAAKPDVRPGRGRGDLDIGPDVHASIRNRITSRRGRSSR